MGLVQGGRGSIVAVIVVCVVLMAQVAHPAYRAWVFARFADTPEGLAVDAAGNIYTALFHKGQIMKVTLEGTQALVAVVPSEKEVGKGNTIGMDLDKEGNIYVVYKQDPIPGVYAMLQALVLSPIGTTVDWSAWQIC